MPRTMEETLKKSSTIQLLDSAVDAVTHGALIINELGGDPNIGLLITAALERLSNQITDVYSCLERQNEVDQLLESIKNRSSDDI